MSDTIFMKIIKGEIPCHKVYEDELTLAFLDIHPVQPGMVLVISKEPAETFLELDPEHYTALWQTVHKVAHKLKDEFPQKQRVAIQVEGLDVPHVHVKLFPFNTTEEFHAKPDMAEPNHAVLAELAQRLAL